MQRKPTSKKNKKEAAMHLGGLIFEHKVVQKKTH